jgi:hypothetical protein
MTTVLGELRPIGEGQTIELTKERVLIGRHRLCDIVIHATQVAPVQCDLHCERSPPHAFWYVRNLSDGSPTKVNAMEVGEERLHPGDILWFGGKHKCELDYDPNALAANLGCSQEEM